MNPAAGLLQNGLLLVAKATAGSRPIIPASEKLSPQAWHFRPKSRRGGSPSVRPPLQERCLCNPDCFGHELRHGRQPPRVAREQALGMEVLQLAAQYSVARLAKHWPLAGGDTSNCAVPSGQIDNTNDNLRGFRLSVRKGIGRLRPSHHAMPLRKRYLRED
jgi:hypothetical protein